MEDFNLSDKIRDDDDRPKCILEISDVKEFIKRLKEQLIEENGGVYGWVDRLIDKLAGDKLI